MLSVTFDTNTYRPIVSPEIYTQDPDRVHFDAIRAAIVDGRIRPWMCETVFSLEAIPKKDRQAVIGHYKPKVRIEEKFTDEGVILSMSIGPDDGAHPGTPAKAEPHLSKALALGFKLLREPPRVAMLHNATLQAAWFEQDSDAKVRQERSVECCRAQEARGCGVGIIQALAAQHGAAGEPWIAGLQHADEHQVARAVAEWADGDSIAAHYGYQGDVFCTRDTAKGAGARSVLSPVNRQWLTRDFGLEFASPAELAARLRT